MSVNKAILIGNVGKDPEVRHLSDTKVANFTLATSESYTSKSGEKVTTTEWHNIVVWRGLAEVVEKYVSKGSKLYVEGKIFTRSWDDKDGVKRYKTEIQADTIQILSGWHEGSQKQQQQEENLPTYESPVKNSGMAAVDNANKDNSLEPQENDLPF